MFLYMCLVLVAGMLEELAVLVDSKSKGLARAGTQGAKEKEKEKGVGGEAAAGGEGKKRKKKTGKKDKQKDGAPSANLKLMRQHTAAGGGSSLRERDTPHPPRLQATLPGDCAGLLVQKYLLTGTKVQILTQKRCIDCLLLAYAACRRRRGGLGVTLWGGGSQRLCTRRALTQKARFRALSFTQQYVAAICPATDE